MSTIHLKPDGAFCGGTLIPRKAEVQWQQLTLYVNGQPVKPVVPMYARCIECGTEVLLNPPKPEKQLDAEFEVVKDAPVPNN